ncbi:hypothetical protein GQ600_10717 [Phytophthora cactorum]|nr:hypothetical protein GQ600_10717 [Phytophthora cactorum]
MALLEDHALEKAKAILKLKAAARHIDEAMERAITTSDCASKRRGALQKLWMPTQREIGIYIAHWLITAGLPYNKVVTEDFTVLFND